MNRGFGHALVHWIDVKGVGIQLNDVYGVYDDDDDSDEFIM